MMTDDIVTQLRWISDAQEWVKLRQWETITAEAADEIERLRADLTYWQKMSERLARWGIFEGEAQCAFYEWQQTVCNESD
jgi:hypothetical protein